MLYHVFVGNLYLLLVVFKSSCCQIPVVLELSIGCILLLLLLSFFKKKLVLFRFSQRPSVCKSCNSGSVCGSLPMGGFFFALSHLIDSPSLIQTAVIP